MKKSYLGWGLAAAMGLGLGLGGAWWSVALVSVAAIEVWFLLAVMRKRKAKVQ